MSVLAKTQEEAQNGLGALIEQATDGIYLLDAGTRRIVERNPSFQGMLGYTTDELRRMERTRHELDVETILCDEPEAAMETKEPHYRIAQEALHNTAKHARAHSVKMRLRCDSERVTPEISDDGVGFDPEGDFPGHLGPRSMRERTSPVRGTPALETGEGKETRLRARIFL